MLVITSPQSLAGRVCRIFDTLDSRRQCGSFWQSACAPSWLAAVALQYVRPVGPQPSFFSVSNAVFRSTLGASPSAKWLDAPCTVA